MIIGLRKVVFTHVKWEYPDHVFTEDRTGIQLPGTLLSLITKYLTSIGGLQ